MRQLWHLITRFLGSLSPRPLDPADAAWAQERLLPGERDLWVRMSRADRKHAAGVAREVDRTLGGAPRPVVAAALLHDVGKIEAGLGTFARAAVTALAAAVGRDRLGARAGRPGVMGRVGTYLRHDAVGADLLDRAGSDPLTVAWAREHHLPADHWTVPGSVGRALAAADDD